MSLNLPEPFNIHFIFILIAVLPLVNSAKNVTIQKCCSFDETFDISKNNTCVHLENNIWNLKVYSPAKKSFLPKHTIPSNWHLKYSSKPQCANPINLREDFANYVGFPNGSLFVVSFDSLIHPNDYCIDYNAVQICKNSNKKTSEVKKCCGFNATFSTAHNGCVIGADPSLKIDILKGEKLSTGYPICNGSAKIVLAHTLFNVSNFYANGSLWLPEHRILLPPSRYCLEHILERSDKTPGILGCIENLAEEKTDLRFILYPIGFALSTIFLAATLACGFVLPATHHVLHWRCQTNYVLCLLIGFTLLCIIQIYTRINKKLCIALAVTIHFFILSAFFWLNTMCFNIWWTFRDLRPQSIEKSQERCRLRLYKIYAWGIPLVIAGAGAILDFLPDNNTLIKPRFGENKCWFRSGKEKFPFFNAPIGLLLTINLVLFILTARELTCGLWKRELVKSTTERAALGRVCMKLVVVMGVPWIADVISDAVGGHQELWYLSDIFNSLQGVFIFIVIGCQPQVLSAIKRLWCFRRHREQGTAGTNHSSTFQGQSTGDTNNTTKSVPVETIC